MIPLIDLVTMADGSLLLYCDCELPAVFWEANEISEGTSKGTYKDLRYSFEIGICFLMIQ